MTTKIVETQDLHKIYDKTVPSHMKPLKGSACQLNKENLLGSWGLPAPGKQPC